MARSPKVLLDVQDGNNLMFLPLDQLLSRSGQRLPASGLDGGGDENNSLINEFNRNANRNREREARQ
jgi:hypothetical protein